MDREEILKKICKKKEFSKLPKKDVELAFSKFERRQTSEEDKIKLTRDLLGKSFFYFSSKKLLNPRIIERKTPEEILKKHISTRERFSYYLELYEKLLGECSGRETVIFDLGAGINGLSYQYFQEKFTYFAIDSIGQFVDLMNYYFRDKDIKKARALKMSLFEINKIKKIIENIKGEKIVFLFKVVDSLEMIERNFTKKFLREIVPLVKKVVVSFSSESLFKREKFRAKRYWFENFVIREGWEIIDIFDMGSEKYFVFKR